jgi:GTPase SAR1 family protein
MRYAVLVTGPAGAGKSTFCSALITHAQTLGRSVHLFNLDPAAERFDYEPTIDIRDLINLEDVMEELEFGPNGGLMYCFEYVTLVPCHLKRSGTRIRHSTPKMSSCYEPTLLDNSLRLDIRRYRS